MTRSNFKFQISNFETFDAGHSDFAFLDRSANSFVRMTRTGLCALLCFGSGNISRIFAATNSTDADEIPPLAPPRGEIPPGFWEQYGVWVVVGGAVLVMVGLFLVWRFTRPKTPIVVPIEVRTRETLLGLRDRPETGALLSQISQTLTHYVAGVFSLPPDEMTTTEFCQALTRNEQIGPQLSSALGQFLRRCDEFKFSPAVQKPPIGAAAQALNLVDLAEARREQLRAAELSKQQVEMSKSE